MPQHHATRHRGWQAECHRPPCRKWESASTRSGSSGAAWSRHTRMTNMVRCSGRGIPSLAADATGPTLAKCGRPAVDRAVRTPFPWVSDAVYPDAACHPHDATANSIALATTTADMQTPATHPAYHRLPTADGPRQLGANTMPSPPGTDSDGQFATIVRILRAIRAMLRYRHA